jgi:hypothetical protein
MNLIAAFTSLEDVKVIVDSIRRLAELAEALAEPTIPIRPKTKSFA